VTACRLENISYVDIGLGISEYKALTTGQNWWKDSRGSRAKQRDKHSLTTHKEALQSVTN